MPATWGTVWSSLWAILSTTPASGSFLVSRSVSDHHSRSHPGHSCCLSYSPML